MRLAFTPNFELTNRESTQGTFIDLFFQDDREQSWLSEEDEGCGVLRLFQDGHTELLSFKPSQDMPEFVLSAEDASNLKSFISKQDHLTGL